MKILLIEDEKKLAKAIQFLFRENKIDCEVAFDGLDGYNMASENEYKAIILDIMLPRMNGYQVLERLRKDGNNTPIIMLTAKSQIEDKLTGFKAGADDYLTKPFDSEELVARINALTRRNGVVVPDILSYKDLSLNLSSGELSRGEESIKLNYKEKEIMKLFLLSPEVTLTKGTIFDSVWDIESNATENSLEVYISFLRKKLKFLKSALTVKSYRKIGYRLEESDD